MDVKNADGAAALPRRERFKHYARTLQTGQLVNDKGEPVANCAKASDGRLYILTAKGPWRAGRPKDPRSVKERKKARREARHG